MTSIAKLLLRLPACLLRRSVETLREYLVHLMLATVVAAGWANARYRSLESAQPRMMFPALKEEELATIIQERDGRTTGHFRGDATATASEGPRDAGE